MTFPLYDEIEDEYTFLFTASEFTGEMTDSPEGNLEWIEDTKVLDLNLWEGDKHFLRWLEDRRLISGKLVYKNGCLV